MQLHRQIIQGQNGAMHCLDIAENQGYLSVYLDGVALKKGTDYTENCQLLGNGVCNYNITLAHPFQSMTHIIINIVVNGIQEPEFKVGDRVLFKLPVNGHEHIGEITGVGVYMNDPNELMVVVPEMPDAPFRVRAQDLIKIPKTATNTEVVKLLYGKTQV